MNILQTTILLLLLLERVLYYAVSFDWGTIKKRYQKATLNPWKMFIGFLRRKMPGKTKWIEAIGGFDLYCNMNKQTYMRISCNRKYSEIPEFYQRPLWKDPANWSPEQIRIDNLYQELNKEVDDSINKMYTDWLRKNHPVWYWVRKSGVLEYHKKETKR